MKTRWIKPVGAGLIMVVLVPLVATAQAPAVSPSHAYVVSGYGTVGGEKAQGTPGSFFASVAPIFLFQFTDKVLAETELEFELEEGATKTGLEYIDISILLNDYVTVTAGKFLLPFGVFGQRLHPNWINRFATFPPLFGHGGGVEGIQPLVPVMADIGVMTSAVIPVGGGGRSFTFAGFATNGPMAEESAEMGGGMGEIPELAFGETVADNNNNKMLGGRVGFVAPNFEINVSTIWSQWGKSEFEPFAETPLVFWGYNGAADVRVGSLEVRGEWLRLFLDAEEVDTATMTSTVETVKRWGGYAQASYRLGDWEPVVRFSLVEPNEGAANDRLYQYGLGLNYWITPSIAVMGAFELNRDKFDMGSDLKNNRVLMHWAFGF